MIQPEDIAQAVRFLALLPGRTVPEMQVVPMPPRVPKLGKACLTHQPNRNEPDSQRSCARQFS